jgi:hypothetical protein|uniref:Uncharacterized protein n=1 Tax=viral metagenome TaxID=1070528 RepID=A0A6C0BE94_9ZZZZ
MIPNTDKPGCALSDDYCLDLIMNQSKVSKKSEASANICRLYKTFQILETTVLHNKKASDNIDMFCKYLEQRIKDIIVCFEKDMYNKSD